MTNMLQAIHSPRLMPFKILIYVAIASLIFTVPSVYADGGKVAPRDPGVTREFPIDISQKFIRHLSLAKRGEVIKLRLPTGKTLPVKTRQVREVERGFHFSGAIASKGLGTVTLVVVDRILSGSINYNSRFFRIQTSGRDGYVLREIDPSLVPVSEADDTAPIDDEPVETKNSPALAKVVANRYDELSEISNLLLEYGFNDYADTVLTLLPDDGSQVDVMVVWTDAAAAFLAERGMDTASEWQFQVSQASDMFFNSGIVNTQLNLVHSAHVNYRVTDALLKDDLDELKAGQIAGIQDLRNTHRADLVVLMVNNDLPRVGSPPKKNCGRATVLRDRAAPGDDSTPGDGKGLFAYKGFSVVSIHCALNGYTFGHEVAHNFGAHHDVYAVNKYGSAGGVDNYSHGFVLTGPSVITAMAYYDFCQDWLETSCSRIALFSNPQRDYLGYPTGINPSGDFLDASNNARTINESAWTVANFRNSYLVLP